MRIDGLVNNVGVSLHTPLADVDPAGFREILDANVVRLVAVTQAVLPAMREQRFGRIVNISSGSARMVLAGDGAYVATKSAVNMLSAVFRAELAAAVRRRDAGEHRACPRDAAVGTAREGRMTIAVTGHVKGGPLPGERTTGNSVLYLALRQNADNPFGVPQPVGPS
ncbi:SDR family oxidoreductase [Catenulispora pinisilvae]|uniref:SDR family oxidoreductase n=1 Tax=Catenulispora pinisilvae TaxID=2705253 RepID=UPI001891AEFE|nr:SDR family NAD(P)-dependent oxidoreductase [Catenulispora pinisilvae]